MAKSRFLGEVVFLQMFGESEFVKTKIIGVITELGAKYYKCESEGKIFYVSVDGVQTIALPKSAKVLPLSKIKLVK